MAAVAAPAGQSASPLVDVRLEDGADSTDSELALPEPSSASCPQKRKVKGYWLMNLAAVAWMADQVLLLALLREFSERYQLEPFHLSLLLFVKGISESLASIPSGFMTEKVSRPTIILAGSTLWAAGLVGCSWAEDFYTFLGCRVLNGIGLGLAQPVVLSLVCDTSLMGSRGLALGTLQFNAQLGASAGRFIGGEIAPLAFSSVAVWKLVFGLFALLNLSVGIAVKVMLHDPEADNLLSARKEDGKTMRQWLSQQMDRFGEIVRNRTFLIFVVHAALIKLPWFAFSWNTLWVALLGSPDQAAPRTFGFFGAGQAFGAIIVGGLLDEMSRRSPSSGAPWVAMAAAVLGVPVLGVLTFYAGTSEATGLLRLALLAAAWLAFGTLVSWWAVTKEKIFSDIVPQADFSRIFALGIAVEGTLDAFISPAVIYMDRWMQFSTGGGSGSGECILAVGATAWIVCLLIFAALRTTYAADRRNTVYEQAVPF